MGHTLQFSPHSCCRWLPQQDRGAITQLFSTMCSLIVWHTLDKCLLPDWNINGDTSLFSLITNLTSFVPAINISSLFYGPAIIEWVLTNRKNLLSTILMKTSPLLPETFWYLGWRPNSYLIWYHLEEVAIAKTAVVHRNSFPGVAWGKRYSA